MESSVEVQFRINDRIMYNSNLYKNSKEPAKRSHRIELTQWS